MATTINNLDQSIAWGVTPSWVYKQLTGQLKSGTATGTGSYKDGWGKSHSYTYTYTVYGLSTINPDGFNLTQWNSYNLATQGSKANDTYFNNGGGYNLNANTSGLTITQNPGDITYGTPVQTVSTEPAQNSSGQTVSTTIDNTLGSTPITQSLSLTYEITDSSNSSTTNGWSNTFTIGVGASVSAEIDGIGAEVNTSVTNATTIDSSDTSGTENSQSSTTSQTTQVTVDPGYKIQVVVNYNSQNITLPYTSPVTVTGSSKLTDMYGNSLSYNVGDAVQTAIQYGMPNSAYAQGTNTTGSSTVAKLLATGNIYNLNSTDFTITQYTLASPSTPASSSLALRSIDASDDGSDVPMLGLSAPARALALGSDVIFGGKIDSALHSAVARADGATITIKEAGRPARSVKTGLMYTSDDNNVRGSVATGSSGNDWIELSGRNQVAHTFGGSDIVKGSKFADKIYSDGDYETGDNISAGAGADLIVSNNSGDKIDAGVGSDRVFLTLDNGAVDDVTLGAGDDQLYLAVDSGLKTVSAIIRDLGVDDNLIINGQHSSLAAVRSGSNVELTQFGKPIVVFQDYAREFDNITGTKLIELSLNNIDLIASDNAAADHTSLNLTDWREALMRQSALGNDLNMNFEDLKSNKGEFGAVVKSLSSYLLGTERTSLLNWADNNASNFDTAIEFAGAFVARAERLGLTPDLPGFAI